MVLLCMCRFEELAVEGEQPFLLVLTSLLDNLNKLLIGGGFFFGSSVRVVSQKSQSSSSPTYFMFESTFFGVDFKLSLLFFDCFPQSDVQAR